VAGAPDRSNTPVVVVIVAIVGLLATVGSAALGGYWANKSVERQFESQRTAEIQDQRREVYVDYLHAVEKLCEVLTAKGIGDESNRAAGELLNQAGRVRLIAGSALKDFVSDATNGLVFIDDPSKGPCGSNDKLKLLLDSFVAKARPDLATG
jgi:hypothetical protein